MNNKITDVMIHTNNTLSENEFKIISKSVYQDEGIVSFSRNAKTPNLLMVVYNTGKTRATKILEKIHSNGINASLVGI